MRRICRVLLLTASVLLARADTSSEPLPPLEGQLAGRLVATLLPGAPALQWSLTLSRGDADTRHVVATAEGNGAKLRLEAEVNLRTKIATWRLTEGTLDLNRWHDVIARATPALADVSLSGILRVTGRGVLEGAQPSGEFDVVVPDSVLKSDAAGWTLDHVSLEGRFAVTRVQVRSVGPLTFKIGTITTKRFGARNLVLNGLLENQGVLQLSSARLEIAGGSVIAAPASIPLNPVKVDVDLTLNRIGLQDVAALVPTAVRGARGRVDGTVEARWNAADGLDFGRGHIVLRKDEPAEVTLRPSPGLFTSGLRSVMNLPRWLVRKSPIPALQRAELGQTPIQADSLDITFSQTPDDQGRTAVVRLTGKPKGVDSDTPVTVDTNVHGPLRQFIQIGSAEHVSLDVH